jgi:hypothetical protein
LVRLLFAIVVLTALASWIVATWAAVSIFRLAPADRKLDCWRAVSLWQFAKVRAMIGPAAEGHIRSFRNAFLAFFIVILSVIIFIFLMAMPS